MTLRLYHLLLLLTGLMAAGELPPLRREIDTRIEPMRKVAKTIRNHKEFILNWFREKKQLLSGMVERLNTNVTLTIRKSYGFRPFKAAGIALYHTPGKFPELLLTHRFY